MNYPYALGVIGAGHIAGVIINRLLQTNYFAPDRIIASASRAVREHPLPVKIVDDVREVVRRADRILVSVTPQKFAEMAANIKDVLTPDHLIVSVMAGIGTDTVAAAFSKDSTRVVRCMPNLPFGLGYGVTGVMRGRHATRTDVEEVRHMFGAGGATV